MNCDQRRDMMLLYAAGALDAAETDELRRHLATGCPQCAGSLAEAEATVASLALTLPPKIPSVAARDRLMKKVLASKPKSQARAGWKIPLAAGLAAAVAACVTVAILWGPMRDGRLVASPDVKFVSLGAGVPQPKATGRILWDKDKNDWHVYVFDLAPPAPGKTYELWFITEDQKKVRGGTFTVDASGRGGITVPVPPGLGKIMLAAVTDEPEGGVDQPTGQIQLVGKMQ